VGLVDKVEATLVQPTQDYPVPVLVAVALLARPLVLPVLLS
jgi:hypothetical protein